MARIPRLLGEVDPALVALAQKTVEEVRGKRVAGREQEGEVQGLSLRAARGRPVPDRPSGCVASLGGRSPGIDVAEAGLACEGPRGDGANRGVGVDQQMERARRPQRFDRARAPDPGELAGRRLVASEARFPIPPRRKLRLTIGLVRDMESDLNDKSSTRRWLSWNE